MKKYVILGGIGFFLILVAALVISLLFRRIEGYKQTVVDRVDEVRRQEAERAIREQIAVAAWYCDGF